MKEARKLLNNAGSPLYRVVIAFSLIKELLIIPIISFIWKITLMTTPEGFISNANIGKTLLRSPWILLIGLALLLVFLIFSMWQTAATVLGAAYAREGKRTRIDDLLKISFDNIIHGTRPKNWMLLLYTAIILPLTNVFQASDMFGAFVMPEYIQDFIDSKPLLTILSTVLALVAFYFAVRWFYVLPAFFLKDHDFKLASKESFAYTKKGGLKSALKLGVYGFIESLRLAILPFATILILCSVVLALFQDKPHSSELYMFVIVKIAVGMLQTICGVLVYLSSMCYVVNEYYKKCEESNTTGDIQLAEVTRETARYTTGRRILVKISSICAIFVTALYALTVWVVSFEPEFMDTIMSSPEVIAHKGYSSKAPENTMDAFELADETEKADFIELDVWSSKDGIPVVLHNETIKAATGFDGAIYDYTYEELQKIQAPYSMDPEKFPNARIPKLEDVIATYANTTPILIEIKGYKVDEQLPAKIVALMEKYKCTETCMIHSGDYAALKAVKQCNNNIECGLIQAIVTGNCYDLPYADFLSVEHSFVTRNMISQLHRRGKKLYVWTVNYGESVEALSSLEVDGIITDYPDDIANAVDTGYNPIESFKSVVENANNDAKDNVSSAQAEFEAGDY